jgi:dienelactone hydrolase
MMPTRAAAAALLAGLLLAASGSCSGLAPANVTIAVDHPTALADVPLHVTIGGLSGGQRVTVEAGATDAGRRRWASSASFQADAHGALDLATAAPSGGLYHAPEAMGLIRSMVAIDGGSDGLAPPLPALHITLTVRDGGTTLASRTVTRVFTANGVTERRLALAQDGFIGHYFAPASTGAPRPAVMLMGGADGGLHPYVDEAADLLASHGFPALAVGYFGLPGLPPKLAGVRLEYFMGALTWLRGQPGVDRAHVLAYGGSRGSEVALLLGAHRPDLVQGVVANVPSNVVHCAFPDCDGPSWFLNGAPLPYTRQFLGADPTDQPAAVIPVEQIVGPVLLMCAEADRTWPSCPYARAIDQRLTDHADPNRHQLLAYPAASHSLGGLVPDQPGTTSRADALAEADAWQRLVDLLTGLGSP